MQLPNPFGLPDHAFEQRRPLKGQITKKEVRAVSLHSLGLRPDSVVWDIGAGTGSVGIEAGHVAHRGTVYAIERDQDSIGLLRHNVEKYSRGNVRVIVGAAPEILGELPDPHSVFIGGSGGQLLAILDTVASRLQPDGHVVVNLAILERTHLVYQRFKDLGFTADMVMVNAARGKEMPGGGVRLEALNPVFVVTASSQGGSSDE